MYIVLADLKQIAELFEGGILLKNQGADKCL